MHCTDIATSSNDNAAALVGLNMKDNWNFVSKLVCAAHVLEHTDSANTKYSTATIPSPRLKFNEINGE